MGFGQNWSFLTKNWPKWPNLEFSSKMQKRHLFTFPETSVDAKNQKNLMRGFLEKCGDGEKNRKQKTEKNRKQKKKQRQTDRDRQTETDRQRQTDRDRQTET